MATISKPMFPNVPALPGVPQVPRSLQFAAGPSPVLNGVIALGRLALSLTTKPVWGIYRVTEPTPPDASGIETITITATAPPVLLPDSFSRFSQKQEWAISTAPVQEGGFATYNKVNSPYEITLRMTKGGSLESRKDFLDNLEALSGSLKLYKVVTPERVYVNCNVLSYRVVRDGAQGAYFLTEVEVTFIEVRTTQAQYTSTAANTQNATNPSAAPVTNRGTLNSAPASSRVVTAIDNVLAPLRKLGAVIGAG